jgi:hypothetical protein
MADTPDELWLLRDNRDLAPSKPVSAEGRSTAINVLVGKADQSAATTAV